MSVTKMKRTSASGSGSGSGSGSPKVLPSPPESVLPSEEDISRGFWQEDEHGGGGGMESEESTMRLKEKGKEKEKEERRRRGDLGRGLDEEYEDEDEVGEVEGGVARYPPTKEQELESRRIQEVRLSPPYLDILSSN